MNLLLPTFLTAGMLIAIPILLHLLRKKPQEFIMFPSLRFLGPRLLQETRRFYIRRWLVLILRCLVILLIVGAFSRPFFASKPNAKGRCVVVAVDNSFSMQTGNRWPVLMDWALSEISNLKPGDQMGVLLMNPTPSWLVQFTSEFDKATKVLSELKPGWETTRYRSALLFAAESLRVMPFTKRDIIWMADEQNLGWMDTDFSKKLPPGVKIVFGESQPTPQRQAAITSISARKKGGFTVVEVTIEPFMPDKDNRTLTLFQGEHAVGTKEVFLSAGNTVKTHFRIRAPEKETEYPGFRVELNRDDLAADDSAYALLNLQQEVVAILSESPSELEKDYILHALSSTVESNLQSVKVRMMDNSEWSKNNVLILRGGAPFRGAALTKLETHFKMGGTAWLLVDGDRDQLNWLKKHGIKITQEPQSSRLRLRNFDLEHAIFLPFSEGNLIPLLSLEFNEAYGIKGGTPLANWGNDSSIPAIAEAKIGNGRLLLTGFGTARHTSNLPLSPAFVPFVHRAVTWLANNGKKTTEHTVGEQISLPPGEGAWSAIESAEKIDPVIVSDNVRAKVPGIYQFETAFDKNLYAVNPPFDESDLTSFENESELLQLESKMPGKSDQTNDFAYHPGEISEQKSPLWWWILLFSGLIVIGELVLSNRTVL